MTDLLLAVMAQARHARAVHSFICELLTVLVPELVRGSGYIRNSTEFCELIDLAIRDVSSAQATERDYVRAIVDASCREMSKVCGLLRYAAAISGLGRIADEYLDEGRFREMLLRQDAEKLEDLIAIVRRKDRKPAELLTEIAAALNGGAVSYDEMDARAKRKATLDTRKIIAEVKTVAQKLDEGKAEIVGHVDAVGAKVDRLKPARKRKSKYGDEVRAACLSYWEAAQGNAEVRHSLNTRVTYEAVFARHRRELEAYGIKTLAQFRKILHAAQSMACERRRKKLDAQRDGTKKKHTTKKHF